MWYFISIIHVLPLKTAIDIKSWSKYKYIVYKSSQSGMLITIVDTTNFGKFILHKYPYQKLSFQNFKLQDKITSTDITDSLTQIFDYFGIYNTNKLIETSGEPLSEQAVRQIFIANEKNSQIVLGIDDNCVLVSKSTFFRHKTQKQSIESDSYSQNGVFIDINEEQESAINSISIVWRGESYDRIEETKHRLSYLLGVLQRRQEHSQFLTKEIKRIMEQKDNMRLRIKNLIALNNQDNSQQYDEFKLRIVARDIEQEAKKIRQRIGVFRFLKEYHESWIKDGLFQIKDEEGIWEGSIQNNLHIQKADKNFIKKVQNKTLVMLPPKLAELLPNSLYSHRVKTLCQKAFNCDRVSFKKNLEKNSDIDPQEMYHTLYFLLKNNLAVDIYPINYPFSYNLFSLRDLPQKHIADKFNRLFPHKNCIQTISTYSRYKIVRDQQETIIYLLLKQLVGQVKIFVYRKFQSEKQVSNMCNRQVMLENILDKYNMSEVDLNQFLMIEPFPFLSKETTPLNAIIKFIKDRSKYWGFYFLE